MATFSSLGSEREQQFHAILLALVQALEKGESVDQRQFLAAHSEFAAELEEFFAGRDCLRRLTAQEPAGLEPLGDFQLLREIGRGGMGIVYEARQVSLDRRVALKVLPRAAGLDSRPLQRFKN